MRSLIVSDIHANIEALEAVLRDAEGRYDEIWCLGDLVGYGASPGEVIAWARANVGCIVRGNHDRACCGLDSLEDFNPVARAAALWTRGELTGPELGYLAGLPRGPLTLDGCVLAHGSPLDEDEYVAAADDLWPLQDTLMRKMCFIGHTHLQGGWNWTRGGVQRLPRLSASERERVIDVDPDAYYVLNPGSVGQPRDQDPRAAYLIWDRGGGFVAFRRAAYNIRPAQLKILEAGLPQVLARRLGEGR